MNSLEQAVLELIGENTSSPDVFTDDAAGMAQIRGSLNDAIEEIAMVTGSVRRTVVIPLEADVNFYLINQTAGTVGWIEMAWLTGIKRKLDRKDLAWMTAVYPGWLDHRGNPERYGQVGHDRIWIHPTPSAASYQLELTVALIPARYTTDSDRVFLRDEYKWAAVHYALSEYWASRGDAVNAAESFKNYLDILGLRKLYVEQAGRVWQQRSYKADSEAKAVS